MGNEIEEAYFGVDGKPCMGNDGYAKVITEDNENRDERQVTLFDSDDNAVVSRKFTQRNVLTEEIYFNRDKYDKVVIKYDNRRHKTEQICFNMEEDVKIVMKYDIQGHIIEEAYFSIDGQPRLYNDGYAKIVFKYSKNGKVTKKIYFDLDGNQVEPQ